MQRTTPLRGSQAPSNKQLREQQNTLCVGGMRDPAAALHKVPGAYGTGQAIHDALSQVINSSESFLHPCRARFDGRPTDGFSTDQVEVARAAVRAALGSSTKSARGLQADIIDAYVRHSADPDGDLATWLTEGAPMGIQMPVTSRGSSPSRQHRLRNGPPATLPLAPRAGLITAPRKTTRS